MRAEPLSDATLELLLRVHPLLQMLKGDKKAALQRAWINAANGTAMDILNLDDEGRLPVNPQAAAQALLRAVIEIALVHGITGAELTDHFNSLADSGATMPNVNNLPRADEAIARGFALLSVLAALRLPRTDAQRAHEIIQERMPA